MDWTAYDADPVPRHRVEALEASQLERHLREEIRAATEAIDAIGGQPFGAGAARELADAALGGRWGLPPGLPARAARVIALAGTIDSRGRRRARRRRRSPHRGRGVRRGTALLLRLQRASERALADATNAACAVLAGWRPA